MRARLVSDNGQRTYVVVMDTGDEVVASLQAFAEAEKISAAQVTAIGALSHGTLGFFEWERKDYRRIPVNEQVEVVSMNGDVGVDAEGRPALHLHSVLGRSDGSTIGGHLIAAHVRPTLEVIVTESPAHLHRCHDAETGLSLIRLPAIGRSGAALRVSVPAPPAPAGRGRVEVGRGQRLHRGQGLGLHVGHQRARIVQHLRELVGAEQDVVEPVIVALLGRTRLGQSRLQRPVELVGGDPAVAHRGPGVADQLHDPRRVAGGRRRSPPRV